MNHLKQRDPSAHVMPKCDPESIATFKVAFKPAQATMLRCEKVRMGLAAHSGHQRLFSPMDEHAETNVMSCEVGHR